MRLATCHAADVVQDGRIHIERPFLFKEGGSPAEYPVPASSSRSGAAGFENMSPELM